jgi:riboflavin synthase
MFSGIVEELGNVAAVDDHRLAVTCSTVPTDSAIGASVAVNGVCLTVVERADDRLAFDVSAETLARTALGSLRPGAPVNLERPVTLATRLGGHLVQGHVDGVGRVVAVDRDATGGAALRIELPPELRRYVVHKGSIAVDGVSLTVAELHDDGVSIALIPHTLAVTTLGTAAPGDAVHLEVDVIAKYVERLAQAEAGRTDRGEDR